jgi:hypothetical protein
VSDGPAREQPTNAGKSREGKIMNYGRNVNFEMVAALEQRTDVQFVYVVHNKDKTQKRTGYEPDFASAWAKALNAKIDRSRAFVIAVTADPMVGGFVGEWNGQFEIPAGMPFME